MPKQSKIKGEKQISKSVSKKKDPKPPKKEEETKEDLKKLKSPPVEKRPSSVKKNVAKVYTTPTPTAQPTKVKDSAKHSKDSGDNIIRKIKSFLFKNLLKKLNDSLKDTNDIFYPLETELNENINKEFNEQLLKMSISDIFENTKLNKTNENKKDVHKKLIQKIKEDKNTYQETLSILSMSFQAFLTKIRNEEKEEFLEEIKKKEEKNKSNNDDNDISENKLEEEKKENGSNNSDNKQDNNNEEILKNENGKKIENDIKIEVKTDEKKEEISEKEEEQKQENEIK